METFKRIPGGMKQLMLEVPWARVPYGLLHGRTLLYSKLQNPAQMYKE